MLEKLQDRINNWMNPKDKYPKDMIYNLLFVKNYKYLTVKDIKILSELEISKRPVQVAVIRIGDGICDPEKLNTIVMSCSDVSGSDEVLPLSDARNQVILLFFSDTLWEGQAREILEDIKKAFLTTWPDSHLHITLGAIEDYVEHSEPAWQKSYRTALGLQSYCYIKPRGKVIAHSDIVARRNVYPKGISFHFDLLKKYLESENPDLLHGWLSGIYSIIPGNKMDSFGLLYHLTLEIVVNVISLFQEKGLSVETYIEHPDALIKKVLSIDTAEEMQKWMGIVLENCRKILQQPEE